MADSDAELQFYIDAKTTTNPGFRSSYETFRAREPEREPRLFWAITDNDTVERAIGFDCGRDYPGQWWVPELGCTMTEGKGIFADRNSAVFALVQKLEEKSRYIDSRLAVWRPQVER